VDKYKDSKIDLEMKKEGSNPYSTRTLVKPSLVAYIKPGRGAPRGTSDIRDRAYKIDETKIDHRLDTQIQLRRPHVNTIVIIY
jgi:hypothetical protein